MKKTNIMNNLKKHLIKTGVTASMLAVSGWMSGQVGINSQDPKATLDITAKTTDGSKPEGVIAPRLTGNQIKLADAQYNSEQTGTIVYATSAVTASSIKTANITSAGYYYYDGSAWQKMTGNAGASTNYSGSTSVILNGSSFERAALTGDVTASQNDNTTTVTRIQGTAISSTVPTNGQILKYNGTSWTPSTETTVTNNVFYKNGSTYSTVAAADLTSLFNTLAIITQAPSGGLTLPNLTATDKGKILFLQNAAGTNFLVNFNDANGISSNYTIQNSRGAVFIWNGDNGWIRASY